MTIQALYPDISPSLSLDFANVKQLDPRVTFARASTARYYDGKTVAKAEENLLLRSQEFETASWTKSNTTATANTTVAPDGTTTADTFLETAATSAHGTLVNPLITLAAGTYTASCFIKANGRTAVALILSRNTSNVHVAAVFDLTAVAVTQTFQQGSGVTNVSSSITEIPVGSGWYRCVLTGTVPAASDYFVGVYASDATTYTPDNFGRNVYAGDITKGLILWGAQLEQRSTVTAYTATTTQPITNYIPVLLSAADNEARFDHNPTTSESLGLLIEEQRTNIILQSETITTTPWVNPATELTYAQNAVAPNGTTTGWSLTETTMAGQRITRQDVTTTVSNQHTLSVYVKPFSGGSQRWLGLRLADAATPTVNFVSAVYDIVNGSVSIIINGGNGTGTTASIVNVGNGWYRCVLSGIANTSGTSLRAVIGISNSSTAVIPSYTGALNSGLFLWGAQLEAGAFPTSYIPTVASQVTRSADAASMTGTNFSSWYRQDEGSFYSDAATNSTTGSIFSVEQGNTTISNSIMLAGFTSEMRFRVRGVVGTTSAQISLTSSYADGQYRNYATAFKTDSFNAALDGVIAGADDTSGTVPTPQDNLKIGYNGSGNHINSTIKKLAFYPKRLTNVQLQAITT